MTTREALTLSALLLHVNKVQQFAGRNNSSTALDIQVLDARTQSYLDDAATLVGSTTMLPNARLEAVTDFADVDNWRADLKNRRYYPLLPLQISDKIFPTIKQSDNDYAGLWDDFVAESQRLPTVDFEARFDSLTHLLHKYMWSVPVGEHWSLYDHSRITAALAVCLHDAGDGNEKPFLLIEGGVSGIQNFIYNPAFNGQELQDGMARRLRGRSFYLNLVVKTLADYVTKELDLYSVNTIRATGGHFLIVAPNNQTTRDKLTAIRQTIQQWVWKEFRGALGLLLVDCAVGRAAIKDFTSAHNQLEELVSAQKYQQFAAPLSFGNEIPDDESWENAWVLKMQQDICRDTGGDLTAEEVEFSRLSQKPKEDNNGDEEDAEQRPTRSPQSLLYDGIGRVLLKAQTVQLQRANDWKVENAGRLPRDEKDARQLRDAYEHLLIEFPDLNRTWLLTSATVPQKDAQVSLRIADHKNSTIEFLPQALSNPAPETAQGFQFLANAVKTEEKNGRDRLVDFHVLAEAGQGANFLGVLRMDVDNLGFIFSEGLLSEAKSLVSIAGLSRLMDWFFTGYLNELVKDKNLYTTYAGGDDLLIVGAWNEVLDVANKIQQQFKAFCGNHPAWHISGGITLCKGKYPIGRAAEEAEARLSGIAKSSAQDYLQNDTEKNALAFLERKISWQQWNKILPLCEKLIEAIANDLVSRKFLYNLLGLYRQHIDPLRDPTINRSDGDFVLWMSKFLYSLLRNVKDDLLRIELQEQIPKHKDYLSIITGYVLLKTRDRTNQKTQLPDGPKS